MPRLSYYVPSDVNEALGIMATHGGLIVAGGTDVYPSLNTAQNPKPFVDITEIDDLKGITRHADCIRIGGATTWSEICQADLPAAFDGLKAAARDVGSIQIQNVGTVAGNLCNASPAADGVPPLLTLDASIELSSEARGTRRLSLSQFLIGPRLTAREPDEILTAIHLPLPPEDARGSFEKLGSRRYLVISITMTAALVRCAGDGTIAEARIAVGAASPVAMRLTSLERELVGCQAGDIRIDPKHFDVLSPIDDVRGTGEYRLDVLSEQVSRAIRRAAAA